jgi:PII-like signaling protein
MKTTSPLQERGGPQGPIPAVGEPTHAGLFERVADAGGATVVRGEAGIGKSALLSEAT